ARPYQVPANGEPIACLATATIDGETSPASVLSAPVTPATDDIDCDGVPDLIDNCVSIPNGG
ncbi:MAG: hypothetical protein QMB10_03625, partial [Halioglobus sp.]